MKPIFHFHIFTLANDEVHTSMNDTCLHDNCLHDIRNAKNEIVDWPT